MGKSTTISGNGSREGLVLEVDIATYVVPDIIRITGTTSDNSAGENADYLLLDTCRMRTALYPDPTAGMRRPPEDSIREYRLPLRAGTKSLTFDFTQSNSPTYIRVIGLCDFNLTAAPVDNAFQWRRLP